MHAPLNAPTHNEPMMELLRGRRRRAAMRRQRGGGRPVGGTRILSAQAHAPRARAGVLNAALAHTPLRQSMLPRGRRRPAPARRQGRRGPGGRPDATSPPTRPRRAPGVETGRRCKLRGRCSSNRLQGQGRRARRNGGPGGLTRTPHGHPSPPPPPHPPGRGTPGHVTVGTSPAATLRRQSKHYSIFHQ